MRRSGSSDHIDRIAIDSIKPAQVVEVDGISRCDLDSVASGDGSGTTSVAVGAGRGEYQWNVVLGELAKTESPKVGFPASLSCGGGQIRLGRR